MKTYSITGTFALSILVAAPVLAQSSFELQNYDELWGVDAPVFDVNGVPLAGIAYRAELWGGATSDSLSPASSFSFSPPHRVTAPFNTGAGAGYFYATASMAILGVPLRGYVWLQVRAWDTQLGATYEEAMSRGLGGYGESPLFYTRGSGGLFSEPPEIPAPLTGLQSFSLRPEVPEPSTCALLALGGAAICWARWRQRQRRS